MSFVSGMDWIQKMSKKSTMICDRCGKEIPYNAGTMLFSRFYLCDNGEKRFDLCDVCTDKFGKWLKKDV